jgi:hypothetical protein
MILPGWQCPKCHGFNGEAKEELTRCRSCDSVKPITVVEISQATTAARWIASLNRTPLRTPLLTREELYALALVLANFILQQNDSPSKPAD